jgi:hypothetical protein
VKSVATGASAPKRFAALGVVVGNPLGCGFDVDYRVALVRHVGVGDGLVDLASECVDVRRFRFGSQRLDQGNIESIEEVVSTLGCRDFQRVE